MRIAIVGGTGTLGRHVVAALAGRGHETRVLSRRGEYRVDLTTGEGLSQALDGCAAVIDASNATRKAAPVLVDGCQRLLAAEQQAAVGHHVCVSIVGCDKVPMGYYRVKTEQEQVVEHGPVPWTIVRATQFHELADSALTAAARFRIIPVPAMALQTIAAADVASAVAEVAAASPRQARVQVAGPEICSARQLARTWLRATGSRAMLLSVPVPGRLGRALRDGGLTAAHPDVRGTTSFADWLAARQAPGQR